MNRDHVRARPGRFVLAAAFLFLAACGGGGGGGGPAPAPEVKFLAADDGMNGYELWKTDSKCPDPVGHRAADCERA